MEGVNQCMNVDQLDKNWNHVLGNCLIDGLDHQSIEGVSQCTSVDHVDKVRDLMNDIFDTPSGSDSVQDVFNVYESMYVDQTSLVNNVLDDVDMDSVVEDVKQSDVKTVMLAGATPKEVGYMMITSIFRLKIYGNSGSPNDDWAMASPYLSDMLRRYELVPSCFVIFDLEPFSLSFDFVFESEIFKSFSLRSLSPCDLVSWPTCSYFASS
nr:hypothetical protein [Tanacetum cinerariifolium]